MRRDPEEWLWNVALGRVLVDVEQADIRLGMLYAVVPTWRPQTKRSLLLKERLTSFFHTKSFQTGATGAYFTAVSVHP